jgi:hypothetical protein
VAQVFPPIFPHREDPRKWAEAQAFDSFSQLSDDWLVLYSVNWFGSRNGERNDGEADFILLNPDYGALVVEVKGGSEILIKDGVWYSRKMGQLHEIKNPFTQAAETKHFLIKWLHGKLRGTGFTSPHIGHCVVFPAHEQVGDLGPAGDRNLICDRNDLLEPQKTIERIAKFGGSRLATNAEVIQHIRKLLLPDLHVPTLHRAALANAQKTIIELTHEQDRALSMLREAPSIIVRGAAGTGKSVLAVNDAIRAASSGLDTLLLCFNRPLADMLQKEATGITNLTVNSFHGFAHEVIQSSGLGLEIDGDEDLPYHLVQAAELLKLSFDVLIIDEAQDFLSDWWDALESIVSGSHRRVHIFADSAQNLYNGNGLERFSSYTPVLLNVNCRNTLEIASHVNRCGLLDSAVRGAHGSEPLFEEVEDWDDIRTLIAKYLEEWTEQLGLRNDEIAILSDSANLADALFNSQLAEFTLGNGKNNSIKVDTVRRFKGLEAEAVFCIFDPLGEIALQLEELRRHAYVGFSRPRTVLAVCAKPETLQKIKMF